jgi:hypothetical protein
MARCLLSMVSQMLGYKKSVKGEPILLFPLIDGIGISIYMYRHIEQEGMAQLIE